MQVPINKALPILKEVVIANRRFAIGKLSSDDGSFLLMRLIGSLRDILKSEAPEPSAQASLPMPEPELTDEEKKRNAENAAMAAIQAMLMNIDEAMFKTIQKKCLAVCAEYTSVGEGEEVLLPVLTANGTFSNASLKTDIITVTGLTSHTLHGNLAPFFHNSALNLFQVE